MVYPTRHNSFGYRFLSQVNSTTLHPGEDLNWGAGTDDLGQDVQVISDGEVEYSGYALGWGHHIVVYHAKYGVWTHYAHLKTRNVKKGDKVTEGQVIGLLGGSGGRDPKSLRWSPHLHFEIWAKMLPGGYNAYTKGWSKEKVQEYYIDPLPWIAKMIKEEARREQEQFTKAEPWAQESWNKLRALKVALTTSPYEKVDAQWVATVLDRLSLLDKK